jgi:tetratricopeptide (TPR) repeat protein
MLTLYAFTRSCPPPPTGTRSAAGPWRGLSVGACLLGMATKEVMVTAPLLVLLYDRTFAAGSFLAAVRLRRGYYAALASTWLVLAFLVVRSGGARGASAGFGLGLSAWSYLLQQTKALCLYLKLSFWPHPLVLDYGTAVPRSFAEVSGPAIVVTALLAATVWALRRRPVPGFFAAAFFLILAPSSSVVPLATQTMAEHRMYLPLAAILCPIVAVAYMRLRPFAPGLLALLAVGFAGMTAARNRDYRDAVTLWTDNVTHYPGAARAHNNLALALQKAGRPAEADAQFAQAVALDPAYVTAHYNWGVALLDHDRPADAIVQLESAVALAPDHADAQVNLGNALVRVQRSAEAIPHYLAALQLKPAADVYYNLGLAQLDRNRPEDAATAFRSALQLDPTLAEAHYQLAQLAERSGAPAAAEAGYRETLRYAPHHAAAHARLGLLLARANRLPEAAEQLQAAVRLAPGDVDARANLGNVFLLQGQPRDAITCYEEVLRVRPNDSRTRENLQLAREALR